MWGYLAAIGGLNDAFGGECIGRGQRVLTMGRSRVRRLGDYAFRRSGTCFAGGATVCIVSVSNKGPRRLVDNFPNYTWPG